MATRTPSDTEVSHLEEEAAEHLTEEAGRLASDLDELARRAAQELPEDGQPEVAASPRAVAAPALQVLGAGIMVGGIFLGVSPRFYAVIGGLLGVGLSILVVRIRKPLASNLAVFTGLFLIGILMVIPEGPANVFDLRRLIKEALAAGNLLRPPAPFVIGWHALVGWLMGVVGFLSGWVAFALKKTSLAILLPLPVSAMAAISVPESAHLASGIALLVLFAAGLGLLSMESSVTSGDEQAVPLSYQLRKAVKALPLVLAVTVLLYFLAQADFLFPDALIDPAQEPQKPKTVPLSEVEDRVLFEVDSSVSGPWRLGGLDVYDGKDWRLPPFAQSQLKNVPRSGVLDPELEPGVSAKFKIAGLGGLVLPTLPNTVGMRVQGLFAYDFRSGNIRVVNGQVEPGLEYDIAAAALPKIDDLKSITEPVPEEIQQFTDIPPAPPAVRDLIGQAPKSSTWEEFDYLRTYVLDNVVASGPGAPKSITPERVDEMLAGGVEASPFEIVAAQAMLARWIGLPSRVGYGFDGGDQVGEMLQVRPKHGSTFVEVYFPGFKWLPVVGTPRQAKASSSSTGEQRVDASVLPSDDIAIRLVFPTITPASSNFTKQVQRVVLIALPILLFLLLLYISYPAARKALLRSRQRARARAGGPADRIAFAYKEWRDFATDFGCNYPSDTPLMFVHRFGPDKEHRELAWLATRALWGDLQNDIDNDLALYAEELSRSLRRRMASAQSGTLRAVAVVSRLSLKNPYGEENGRVPSKVSAH